MSKKVDVSNPRFHYEIWNGPLPEFEKQKTAISYVENHNAACGYAELALDFSYAADPLFEQYRKTGLGNWMAPVAHISRQVIELHLKALMHSIKILDSSFDTRPLGGHNLESIWSACRTWLICGSYKLQEDARLEMTEHLISAFHEIDPSGDLFRFGVSRKTAFDRQKSYDRVSIELDLFESEFKATQGLLRHWEVVVFRENMKREMGWTEDPHFDSDNYPTKGA